MGWISVKERLPEESGMVLAWRGICVVPAEYWPPSDEPTLRALRCGFYTLAGDNEPMHGVTHWQPLPAPPISERSAGE